MAIVAAGALVLSACTSGGSEDPPEDTQGGGGGTDPTSTEEPGGENGGGDPLGETAKPDLGDVSTQQDEISYSVGQDVYQGYNSVTSSTNSVYNSVINARLATGFWYWGTDGTVYPVPEFGTYELIQEADPMIVEYTIADGAVWEDGTPITYDDYLMDWASSNPAALFGEMEEAPFDSVSTSFGDFVPEGPVGELGGKTFTIEYPDPYPDWNQLLGSTFPAHVLARESGMELEELSQAILDRDGDTVAQTADFWNNSWIFADQTLPDPSIVPSSGPYSLDGATWNGQEFIQLVPNENYFGTPAATANLTFRFAPPETHVQALENLDLHVIEPQATVDTVASITALGDAFVMESFDEFTYEHLDYNFRDGSPFAENAGGLDARQAFAYCAPRQLIVDNLIKPINPDAVVMNVREVYPFQEDYQELVDAVYDGEYDVVDLEKAQAAFDASGLEEGTTVRIGYGAGNARRASEVQLIKDSCDQVGFDIQDASSDGLGAVLESGNWEIALFAWAGSGNVTGSSFWYETYDEETGKGAGNYGRYSNPDVDEAWATIQTSIDPEVHLENIKIVEQNAWADLHSLPVFAFPGIVAYEATLENVIPTAAQTQAPWNAEQWRRVQ